MIFMIFIIKGTIVQIEVVSYLKTRYSTKRLTIPIVSVMKTFFKDIVIVSSTNALSKIDD